VLAWSGNYSSYQAALFSGVPGVVTGASAVFSEFIPSQVFDIPGDVSNVGTINAMGTLSLFQANTVIPEPAALPVTSAGLALASTFLLRRRKA